MAKRASKAGSASGEIKAVFIVQPGPYQGQQLLLASEHAEAALADGWGVETSGAYAPNDTPVAATSEASQSYNDWLASLNEVSEPDPEPPPLDPPAVLTSLAPDTAEIGAADVTMVVNGTGFTPASVIVFNGFDEPIVFISDTQISTVVKPSIFTEAIPLPVEVRNSGGMSNSLDFTFTETAPLRRR